MRVAPPGWTWAKTAQEAITYLDTGSVEALDLDHDLAGDEEYGTGYDVLLWLAEQSEGLGRDLWPREVSIHSANFSRSPQMAGVIRRYGKGYEELPGRRWRRA